MKILKLLAPMIFIAVISGCSKGPDDVFLSVNKQVCKNGNFDALIENAAPESAELMGMLQAMMAEPAKKEELKAKIKEDCEAEGKPEVVSTEIDGDRAVVVVKFADGKTDKNILRKIDGEWKLVIDK